MGYQPLLAETLYESAQLGNNCGDDAEMLQRFKEAHAAATASHNDEVAAAGVGPDPVVRDQPARTRSLVAREWLGVARGAVARLGRETLADAMLAQAEGMLAAVRHDYERALAAADHSIDVTRRLLGPDDPLTIQWEANKGDWQETAGRLDEALQTDIQAREHFERVLGPEHPRVALVSNNEGEVLNLLGRYAEAEVAYQRAVQAHSVKAAADTDVLGLGADRARPRAARPEATRGGRGPARRGAGHPHREARPAGTAGRDALRAGARALVAPRGAAKGAGSGRRARGVTCGDDKKAVAEIDAWLAKARADLREAQSN